MNPPPVPPFDPLGLALPSPFLFALAYLTLTLHFVAMQFTVGGAILLLLSWGRLPGVARFFGTGLPLGFSYLVTFGVPPLLFVQVVYGQFFYSSSVLVGAYWISVIPLIILGYGASYWHRMTRDARPRFQQLLVASTTLCLLAVGYIYTNNLTLSLRPELWLEHYVTNPGGGALNHGEPTLHARYLLFVVPGLFTAGMALVLRSGFLRKLGNTSEADVSHRIGLRAMLVAAVLETGAAVWLWGTFPSEVRAGLTQPGALAFVSIGAVGLGLFALLMAWASRRRAGVGLPVLAAHSLVGAIACLVVARDLVRQIYLRPHFDAATAPVLPQWGMFAAFAITLAAGVAFLAIITTRTVSGIARGTAPAAEPSPPEPASAG